MGSGKTFWARKLSEWYALPYIDLDADIEQAGGQTIATWFETQGEAAFRTFEQKRLHEAVAHMPQGIIACGGGTPCFQNNLMFMKQHGKLIFLDVPFTELYTRLKNETQQRPLLAQLEPEAVKAFIQNQLEQRRSFYEQADYCLPLSLQTRSHFDAIILPYV
ncbi:MAG: shikimate kinase [Chitinophagaceae bacterium]